jgi:hypothetical protein
VGLKIISRGILQVDGEIEGDVQAGEVIVDEKGKASGMVESSSCLQRFCIFCYLAALLIKRAPESKYDILIQYQFTAAK